MLAFVAAIAPSLQAVITCLKFLSDYILFEKDANNEYNHMAIAYDNVTSKRYLESFFHEPNNKYIVGQTIVKITKYQLFDKNGSILFEDTF